MILINVDVYASYGIYKCTVQLKLSN